MGALTNPAAIPYFVIGSRIAPTHLLGWHVWLQGSSPCVKDCLGAALGIVGVAVPTDEHYETKKRTPQAMCVSTVNVAPTGSCELLGEAQ